MKKIAAYILILICFSTSIFAKSKKETKKESNKTPFEQAKEERVKMPYYLPGYEGDVSSLVIPEPEGINLDKENEWLLTFIQTQLIDNFTVCSPIVISDTQNAEKAQNEIGNQENGSFDEEKIGAKFGEAVGASYMLIGQLTYTGTLYNLSLRINDITKNTTVTSVKKSNFDISAIKDGSIINQATEELLKELGIQITPAGHDKLYGVDTESLKKQEEESKKKQEKKNDVTNAQPEELPKQDLDKSKTKRVEKVKDKIVEGVKNYLKHNRRDVFYVDYYGSTTDLYKSNNVKFGIDKPIFSHIYWGVNGSIGEYTKKEKSYDVQAITGLNFYNKDQTSAFFINTGVGFGSNYRLSDSVFLSGTVGIDLEVFEIGYTLKISPSNPKNQIVSGSINIGLAFKKN